MLHQLVPTLAPLPRTTGRARPTGLPAGTMVMTDEGAVPVEYLLSGDKVMTRNGLKELRGTSVVVALDVDVVVIDPEAPMQKDPFAEPVVLPVSQQVLVRDWRAMILHGQQEMLTPVSSLVDDVTVRRETRANLRLIRLHFDEKQVVLAGGLELASARSRAPLSVPIGQNFSSPYNASRPRLH